MSSTTILITSLAITNDLIGRNTDSGAFVFGAMSFVDKISNGLSVMLIEQFKPALPCSTLFCQYYYRNVLTFVCGGATVIALIALALLTNRKIGQLKRHNASRQIGPIQRILHDDLYEHQSISSPLLASHDE